MISAGQEYFEREREIKTKNKAHYDEYQDIKRTLNASGYSIRITRLYSNGFSFEINHKYGHWRGSFGLSSGRWETHFNRFKDGKTKRWNNLWAGHSSVKPYASNKPITGYSNLWHIVSNFDGFITYWDEHLPIIKPENSKTIIVKKENLRKPAKFRKFSKTTTNNKQLCTNIPIAIEFIGFKHIKEEKYRLNITDVGIENPNAEPWALIEIHYARDHDGKIRTYKHCALVRNDEYYTLVKSGKNYCFPKKPIDLELNTIEKSYIEQTIANMLEHADKL